MADRPILFSEPMVRALLAGTKTQTRRIIKPQPEPEFLRATIRADGNSFAPASLFGGPTHKALARLCRPGDRLWVREAWRTESNYYDDLSPSQMSGEETILFAADADWSDNKSVGRLRAGMHMPRWASRLTLIVTDVRVQRLQEISKDDVIAEGIAEREGYPIADCYAGWHEPYAQLWDTINGAGSWDANPWVAAISFRVMRANIDSDEAQSG